MRHGASGRRSRNRSGGGRNGNNGNRGGNNRSQVFDSNGPDVRIRGTAHQIHEKYTALANDANGSGDYILAESYMQHAEHYQRVINVWQEKENDQRRYAAENAARNEKIEVAPAKDEKEDLGLPASIIGTDEKVVSKKKTELEDV